MALINCPECNKEISEHATSCPNCGYVLPNAGKKNNNLAKNAKAILLVGVMAVLLIVVMAVCLNRSKANDSLFVENAENGYRITLGEKRTTIEQTFGVPMDEGKYGSNDCYYYDEDVYVVYDSKDAAAIIVCNNSDYFTRNKTKIGDNVKADNKDMYFLISKSKPKEISKDEISDIISANNSISNLAVLSFGASRNTEVESIMICTYEAAMYGTVK